MVRFLQFQIALLTMETFLTAKRLHRRHGISHWDSLILASATEMGCSILYSEDLSQGQRFGEVEVVNPFR